MDLSVIGGGFGERENVGVVGPGAGFVTDVPEGAEDEDGGNCRYTPAVDC